MYADIRAPPSDADDPESNVRTSHPVVERITIRRPIGTVGAPQTLDALRSLGACGLDPEQLCRDTALEPYRLERDPDLRVPPDVVASVFAAAERLSGDPLIGLHAAEHSTPRGPLLFLMLAEADLEGSLRAWERYAPIPISSLSVHVDRGPTEVAMTFDVGEPTLEKVPHVTEYLMLAVLRALVMSATGDLRPAQVEFRHPAHGDRAEAERILHCPVVFGSERHAIVFHRQDAARPSRLANPVIARQVAAAAAAAARQATVHATWGDRVADVTRACSSPASVPTAHRSRASCTPASRRCTALCAKRARRSRACATPRCGASRRCCSPARTSRSRRSRERSASRTARASRRPSSAMPASRPGRTGSRWRTRRRVCPRDRPECGAYPHPRAPSQGRASISDGC